MADHLIAESDTAELYPALLRALSPLNRAGTDLPTRAKDIDLGTADLVSVGALAPQPGPGRAATL
ncbi:hypothetical protein ACIBM1_26305 [Streptomyces sp. NPDC050481]|uniref:hypothetical protein n=1 Tax=Streptomyces sp. NPDC050481 TaxID=3365616 RepID=UPI00378FEAFC